MLPPVSPFFKFTNTYSNSERILVLDCTKGHYQYHIGFYVEDDTQYKLVRSIKFTDSNVDTFEQATKVNYAKLVNECKALGIKISEHNNRDRHSEMFSIFSDPVIRNKFRVGDNYSNTVHLFDEYDAYTLKVNSLLA